VADVIIGNPWQALRRHTPAHLGLGRAGVSVPTSSHLAFSVAHALARDAVHARLDVAALTSEIEALGLRTVAVRSRATDRVAYLQRPDLGRQLNAEDEARLRGLDSGAPCGPADGGDIGQQTGSSATRHDVVFVLADGLSSPAAQRHGHVVIAEVVSRLRRDARSWRIGPVVIAEQARVALGDPIGAALDAAITVVLIGERPGWSAPDSLGIYVTWAPRPGRLDAERNCLSNVRPDGLPPVVAAERLGTLLEDIRTRRASGIHVKDEQPAPEQLLTPPFLIGDV